jgi:hypothetical protein
VNKLAIQKEVKRLLNKKEFRSVRNLQVNMFPGTFPAIEELPLRKAIADMVRNGVPIVSSAKGYKFGNRKEIEVNIKHIDRVISAYAKRKRGLKKALKKFSQHTIKTRG